ncbi:MAG: DUF1786 domain-containing protein [Anaerolineae bacterium]|nr:DUF1786 domain-containing protein [Anaerolineae bacterium]MDW8098915.1 DUF1786 domain-containing protein [Anaerolineae bacterium]
MQILAVDVGTGTQDILLFDSERDPENCLKMVMPSPTLLVAKRMRQATIERRGLVLTGVTMGGGPSAWAAEDHYKAGLPIYATPDAARSFNDDLDAVQRDLGVRLVSDDEAMALVRRDRFVHVEMRDLDYPAIRSAFAAFGVELHPDALAVAVFDHGNAPPAISDRQFRLDYLAERLKINPRLSTFAFRADAIPGIMTRLRAVADTAAQQSGLPIYVMDTAPAAILGALEDPVVRARPNAQVVNVGNFHCLAFQFRDGQIARLFEHHTGLLDRARLKRWLVALADGSITHEQVFAEHGHGALILDSTPQLLDFLAVTGPRRGLLLDGELPVYLAAPHGDQMMAGCFGLIRAIADLEPGWAERIAAALNRGHRGCSLW